MRKRKAFFSAILATVAIVVSASGASAMDASLIATKDAPAVYVDNRSSAEVAARDMQIMKIIQPSLSGNKEKKLIDEELAEIGVLRFTQQPKESVSPLSYTTSVELDIYSYYDVQVRQQVIGGGWAFTDPGAIVADANCPPGPQLPCEVGGEEVVGLAFSKDIPVVNTSAYRCTGPDMAEGCVEVDAPFEVNQKGVAWKIQDVMFGHNNRYNMQFGSVLFRTQDHCSLQAFMSYTHTWDNAQISSISVGLGSINVVTSNTAKSWTKAIASAPSLC